MATHSWEVFFRFPALWGCKVLAFHHNSEVSETIHFKGERGSLGWQFWFRIIQSHCFYHCGKTAVHAEGVWRSKPLTCGGEKGGSGSQDPLQGPLRRLHFLKVPLPPKSFYKPWDPSRCWEKWSSPVWKGLPGGCQVWALDIFESRYLWERVKPLSVLAVQMCGDLNPKHLNPFSYSNPLHTLFSLTPLMKLN